MPQAIYNEGRVVGLSAWEIYKRQALGSGVPEAEIPNEHQWLTAMIGSGASMILKISATDPIMSKKGVHDFELPLGSSLSAAGVIVANPFVGTCTCDSAGWAKKVESYGPLIPNNDTTKPSTGSVPYSNEYISALKDSVSEFVKIIDGIVYTKQATWIPRAVDDEHAFIGDNVKTEFDFGTYQLIQVDSVTIDGDDVPETDYTVDMTSTPNTITFNTAPEDNTTIKVYFKRVASGDPAEDIDPDFNTSTTVVRLCLDSDIRRDTYILFTGFTNKRILQGLSGYAGVDEDGYAIGGSCDTRLDEATLIARNAWQNGGMLGPEIIPWASKIMFSVPSFAYNLAKSLTRTIPMDKNGMNPPAYTIPDEGLNFAGIKIKKNSIDGTVKPNSLLDFNSINLTDYYTTHSFQPNTNPVLYESAPDVPLGAGDSYNEIVAWYPGMDATQVSAELAKTPLVKDNFFPPAIYASQITASGTQSLVPLDVAAPGTIKGFTDATQAYNYKQLMKNNFALYHDTTNNTMSFVVPNEPNSANWLGLAKLEYLYDVSLNPTGRVQLDVGSKSAQLLALTKPDKTPYDLTGPNGAVPIGPSENLTWQSLVSALAQEKTVDVLGTDLHNIGTEMLQSNTIGITNSVTTVGAGTLRLTGATPINMRSSVSNNSAMVTLDSGTSLKSGTEFIEFSNGLRLYISDTQNGPDTTNVPIGSIGIGWVNSASSNSDEPIVVEPGELIDEHSVPVP